MSFKNTGAPKNARVYLFLLLYTSTTHIVTSQSSINNPYLPYLSESGFIWSIWWAAGPLAACTCSTCQAAAEAWKEALGVVRDNQRISAVCLRGEKNRLNKLTKLIMGCFMTLPMMQSTVFQQRGTQKCRDEGGTFARLRGGFHHFAEVPLFIFFFSSWCANNAHTQPPQHYIKWTFTQLLLLIMPVCVCVCAWRWHNTLGANGMEAAWRTKEVQRDFINI